MYKWLALIVVIILGLGAWKYMTRPVDHAAFIPSDIATTTVATTSTPAENGPAAKPSPSKPAVQAGSLIAQKGSYQCDYDQVQQSGSSHNVIYLSGGKMRAEFRAKVGNITTAVISVYDGKYLYTWTEGLATGMRTSITSLNQLPTAIPKDLTSGTVYGSSFESVGWKCHAWIADKTLLAAPSYVTFK
jgi:hypothetical protein